MPASRLSRREALRRSILLSATVVPVVSTGPSVARQRPSGTRKVLVAYFSRTGNTRVVAGQVRRALNADLFEIRPAEAYPEDYEATVRQAQRERDAGHEPPLTAALPDIASYEAVFLGFPVWGMTAPPVIRSFLSRHDLSGRTLVPFVTHGGYGLGNSLSVVAGHAPRARLLESFTMRADQERETLAQVTRWLNTVHIIESQSIDRQPVRQRHQNVKWRIRMSSEIESKVVVITGASSGLGEAAARHLARRGARLVLGARRLERLQALAGELSLGNDAAVQTDVTQYEQVRRLVDRAVQAHGRIDVIVNNAGLMPHSPLERGKVED